MSSKKKSNDNKGLDDRPLTSDELREWHKQLEIQEIEELREWSTIAERALIQQAEEIRALKEELESALELLEKLMGK